MTTDRVPPRRAVFLDVDGTYAHHGVVPPGHADAVRAARAAGHRVLLCTGRPRSMLPPRILEAGFDGLVAGAGAYVEVDGEVLVDQRFPADVAARVLRTLDEHDVAYLLEAPEALHGLPGVDVRLRRLLAGRLGRREHRPADQDGPVDILAALRMSEDLTTTPFGKVTYFESPLPGPALVEAIGAEVGVLPSSVPGLGESSGEIYLRGVHKAVGIETVVTHLGVAREDVVAVGDGLNDVEMLAWAGVGVAIAGAHPDVLAVADRVAQGPQVEGLVAAFAELGLT
ncbi:HAD family hydrolase [Cellulomonas carbonis]|uniref:Haloacid dehalogenase n=1 Tax=Cellulomonas carbonis T26 TaxID=947969 RepID=A0A0A0BUL9_9CELL|nr:HAD family hydrolase [Cellulomonas carbonis]KGM10824.1 haloacid dehalogenase [Cellulomonas carbonis T26]GGC16044.1 haloacid dehalogenase [Cellulomonas carbonis]